MLCYSYSWLGWPLLLYMDMKASYYVDGGPLVESSLAHPHHLNSESLPGLVLYILSVWGGRKAKT